MSSLVTIDFVFYLIGAIVMLIAAFNLRDRSNPKRFTTAIFWFLFACPFLFGDVMLLVFGKTLTYQLTGVIVLLLSLIAGFNFLGAGKSEQTLAQNIGDKTQSHTQIQTQAHRTEKIEKITAVIGNKVFLPALVIPFVTILFSLLLKDVKLGDSFVLDQKNVSLTALCVACLCAVFYASVLTRESPLGAVREARRLVDAIGWALILPQMLAMLGGVFVAAKTGQSIQDLVSQFIQADSRLILIITYCCGMAGLTMLMGNAFAAFPIMTAGIALPFLINQHHANPAALVAIGMLSGYCGTLMTPMAANFNIVPAALLELKDKYLVIKTQIPTAIAILICNILLIYFFVF